MNRSSGSPDPDILHRHPRLGFLQCLTLLQKLDRDIIRRTDKCHMAVPRWPVDDHAGID